MQKLRDKYSTAESGRIPGIKKLRLLHKNMMARCYYLQHHAYKNYGGRGITVCKIWHTREAFIDWALSFGEVIFLTLDRIDVNQGYSPENCRWITLTAQLNNTTRSRYIELNGVKKTLSDWAKELKVSTSTIWRRLSRELAIDKVLNSGQLNPWKHGTRSGYEVYKCRCDLCRLNNNARHRAQRLKRKSKNDTLPRVN